MIQINASQEVYKKNLAIHNKKIKFYSNLIRLTRNLIISNQYL